MFFCNCSQRRQPFFPQSPLDVQVAALAAAMHVAVPSRVASLLLAESSFQAVLLQCRIDLQASGCTVATAHMRQWLMADSSTEQADSEVVDLLELFALSCRDIGDLLEPVALLVDHGASASGSAILNALKKTGSSQTHDVVWRSLWRRAAKAQLHQLLDQEESDEESLVAVLAALLVGGELERILLKKVSASFENLPDLLARANKVVKGTAC